MGFLIEYSWDLQIVLCRLSRFLNLGVSFKTDLHPERLLDALQAIERSVCGDPHRDKEGGYIDRRIDIDIMAIEGTEYRSVRLTVPHRHLFERDFFMLPLLELNPRFGEGHS